jgi:hypothetical protein
MTPPLHASDMSEYVPQEHTSKVSSSPQRHLHTSSSALAPPSVALQIHSAYTASLESTTVQGPSKPVLRTDEGPLGILWECGPGLKGAMSDAADVEASGHLDDLQPGGQLYQPERLQAGSQTEQPKSWQASGKTEKLPELQAGGHCEPLALHAVDQPEQPATRLQAVCLPEQPATRLQAVCLPEQPATRLQAVCLPEQPATRLQAVCLPEQPTARLKADCLLDQTATRFQGVCLPEQPAPRLQAVCLTEQRPSSLAGQQHVRLGENGGRSCSLTRMPGMVQQLPVRDSAIAKSNRSEVQLFPLFKLLNNHKGFVRQDLSEKVVIGLALVTVIYLLAFLISLIASQ